MSRSFFIYCLLSFLLLFLLSFLFSIRTFCSAVTLWTFSYCHFNLCSLPIFPTPTQKHFVSISISISLSIYLSFCGFLSLSPSLSPSLSISLSLSLTLSLILFHSLPLSISISFSCLSLSFSLCLSLLLSLRLSLSISISHSLLGACCWLSSRPWSVLLWWTGGREESMLLFLYVPRRSDCAHQCKRWRTMCEW